MRASQSETRVNLQTLGARGCLLVAWLCLPVFASGCFASAANAQALDTSRLPRVAGAKEIYASAPTTIYTVPDPVAQTTEAAGRKLAADGWLQYSAPNTAQAQNPDVQVLSFKKGPQALSVLVTVAPGQGKSANVNYGVKPLANDLPFPPEAADIAFDPNKPYLACVGGQPIDGMLDFFHKALGASGWSPVSAVADQKTEKNAHVFFVRSGQPPLLLVLQRGDDGKTRVELQGVSAEQLAAETRQAKLTAAPGAAPSGVAAVAKAEEPKAPSDETSDAILKQAQQMVSDATAQALSGAKAPAAAPVPGGLVESLGALAGNVASIPLPETAEDVAFDGTEGKLEFSSTSSVQAVAAFYRAAMKPLGWKEQPSVINRSNMVELDFSKAGKDLSLTIMQLGPKVNVTGSGAGLVDAAASAPAAAQDLEAEETAGFPVPKNHTMSGSEETPFRRGLTASVPADMDTVLAFYRRELAKRNWKEQQTPAAVIKPDQSQLTFTSPDGPAVLKLLHKDRETAITLVVRDQAKAASAGMLPKPGQAKLLFGNMLDADAVITVAGQTIKVAAGAGKNGPDGPTLDVPPGKYKVAIKIGSQPAKTEEADVGADEIWGLLVGPGGVLPLQMY